MNLAEKQSMEGMEKLATPVLFDMLSELTTKYTRMLAEGREGEKFTRCKLKIEAIQKEIAFRRDTYDGIALPAKRAPGIE